MIRKVAYDDSETIVWLFGQDNFEQSWTKSGRVDMIIELCVVESDFKIM